MTPKTLVRVLFTAVPMVGAPLMSAIGGCNGSPPPDPHADNVGTAAQADSAPTCVTFERGVRGSTQDTTVDSLNPTQNYGAQASMGTSSHEQSLIRFDLSSLPSGAAVSSATLKVWAYSGSTTDTKPVNFHAITAPWSENTVTWNSFGEAYAAAISGTITRARPSYDTVDLTTLVGAWVSGTQTNYGVLAETAPQNKTAYDYWATGEAGTSYAPQLVVCYTVTVNPCQASPCVNGGACVTAGAGYTCNCPAGYTGDNCETDIDECASEPCANNGACVDQVNGYTCDCAPGFTGDYCETDIDECASEPCVNGGQCLDQVNGYVCACPPGYTGDSCETDIDACESNPCVNGDCVDQADSYSCNCLPGWSGDNCDVSG